MDLRQAHTVALTSQTNIYSSCLLEWPAGQFHLLVASLQGSVVCLDYQLVSGQLRPTSTNIQFLYLPADAEIVSMDCFCWLRGNRPVVGITLVKPGQGVESRAHFLNIYGALRDCALSTDAVQQSWSQHWKNLGEDWQACRLSFTPFKLCHVMLDDSGEDTAFLLSGSDCRVHLYRCSSQLLTFQEDDSSTVKSLFPEFSEAFPASVTSMDVLRQEEHRLVVVGLQNGDMRLWQTDLGGSSPTVLRAWSSNCLDGPVTSLRLLTPVPSRILAPADCGYSLVATCAVEMAAVYHHVKLCGFTIGSALTDSSKYDSVLSTCVTDLDGDGRNEIIIGTYGHMLLVYKQNASSPDTGDFQLVFQHRMAQPIYALFCCDIVGDGLPRLLAVTFSAVVIFQHELAKAADRCTERLKVWKELDAIRKAITSHGCTPVV